MEYDRITLKKRLLEIRESRHFTQDYVAEQTEIGKRTIQNMEDVENDTMPDTKNLIKLCNFYDCDLDYLFGNIDYSKHDLKFICEYTGLSEQTVEDLHFEKEIKDSGKIIGTDMIVKEEYRHKRCAADTINDLMKTGNAFNILSSYLESKTPDEISLLPVDPTPQFDAFETISTKGKKIFLSGMAYILDVDTMKQVLLNKLKDSLDDLIENNFDLPKYGI